MLDLDVTCLIDKLSTLMHEIDDLKYTLVRFVKDKNTLDAMLRMKVNFQKEGLGYTPSTNASCSKHVNSSYFKKVDGVKNYKVRSMTKLVCNYYSKPNYHVSNCQIKKNPHKYKTM